LKLSIIVAAFNEESTILQTLEKLDNLSFPIEKEIIVIDDGSNDKTGELLKTVFESGKFKHFKRYFQIPANLGKASALRIGLALSEGDIIVTQDADLELDPDDLQKLAKPIISGEAEVVFGSRFYNGYPADMKFAYIFINKLLAYLTQILYLKKITDEATAYKMYKKSILRNMRLRSATFEYCPELTSKILNRGYKIIEIPVKYSPRQNDAGKKIRWFDGLEAIWTLLKYRFAEY